MRGTKLASKVKIRAVNVWSYRRSPQISLTPMGLLKRASQGSESLQWHPSGSSQQWLHGNVLTGIYDTLIALTFFLLQCLR